MLALLVAAGTAVPACTQSRLPDPMQPARSLPARIASPSAIRRVQRRAVLRNVTVLRGKTSVEVHMEASAPLKPVARVFSGPQRIVVDLAGVGYDGARRLQINWGDVEDVRVALFRVNPPITRVVVDLARPHQYRLLPAGSTVILAIDTSPKPVPAKGSAPEIAPNLAGDAAPQVAPPVVLKTPPSAPALPPGPANLPTVAAGQPSEPSVSAALPEVSTLPVPSSPAQLSPVVEEETTPHQAAKANKPGVVRGVTVSREKDAIEIHIESSKPLRASASVQTNPERIIIDLADVRVQGPRRIPVNASGVQSVSVALFLVNPLVTRVTVDLAHAHARPYKLRASGNSLTLRIETNNEVKAAGSQPRR
jgi:hypothetical protein